MNKNEIIKLISNEEKELSLIFDKIDEAEFQNSYNVINVFNEENLSESDFASTTGYGFNDLGREKIERIFAKILHAEDALVRSQIISGTHALTITLFGLLRPGDTLLSISGLPYDTLHEVIGIKDNASSLKSYNINYEQVDLLNDDFDYEQIEKIIKTKNYRLITIQRSKGYSERKSLAIEKLAKVIRLIKNVSPNSIIMVDNCYCEFVENKTPLEVGADICVGSLIKNLGGGIAQGGGYVAGKKDLVNLVAERLTVPGEGKEIGPSLGFNKSILMGLYHAPSAVAASLKTAILTSKVMAKLGYNVEPNYDDKRVDIVQNIIFGNEADLIKYVKGIQKASAVDSNADACPSDMPGYEDKVIMASGSFTSGSSIEISCDGPLRKPYIAYQQGSLSYAYGKIALINAIESLNKK